MTRDQLQERYEELEELTMEDTEEDLKRASSYDNNEVSIKKSLLIFGGVAVLMITIFVLNALKLLPWWGTLVSSLVVVLVILGVYMKLKSKD